MKTGVLLAAVATLATATAAAGAVHTVGNIVPLARACYLAAKVEGAGRPAIDGCGEALATEALTREDRAATHVNRGLMLARAGKTDAAIADYDAALALAPDLAAALTSKAVAMLMADRDPRAAVALLDRALASGGGEPWIGLYARGFAHETLGGARAAYADYRQAAALKPGWTKPAEALSRFRVVRRGGAA